MKVSFIRRLKLCAGILGGRTKEIVNNAHYSTPLVRECIRSKQAFLSK
jgi:hypothetical protein